MRLVVDSKAYGWEPAPKGVDLLAGTLYGRTMPRRSPVVLVFDSGVGGLTVHRELTRSLPAARFVYAADDAGFPYGRLAEQELVERVVFVMGRLVEEHRPDLVVIACNTASTLVLPALRQRFPMPFVGTVPAIKPAAAATRSGRIAVLGTPGTVRRDYTRALIDTYAHHVAVDLVGATGLAALAEAALRGEPVEEDRVLAEITPCFVEAGGRRTDVVVLACTHYPLLVDLYRRIAPWPVEWLDPAPAIARRAASLLPAPEARAGPPPPARAVFTGSAGSSPALRAVLAREGFREVEQRDLPLIRH